MRTTFSLLPFILALIYLSSAAFVKCDNKTVWPLEPTYAVLCGVFVSSVFHERSTKGLSLLFAENQQAHQKRGKYQMHLYDYAYETRRVLPISQKPDLSEVDTPPKVQAFPMPCLILPSRAHQNLTFSPLLVYLLFFKET